MFWQRLMVLMQGVHRAAELQVTAETDGQIIQPALAVADGHQVGHGLGGVGVAAVTCVDDRHAGVHGRTQRCALLGVAHGNDVCIVAYHTGGISHRFALAGAGKLAPAKPSVLPPRPAWRTQRKGGCGCWARRTRWPECGRRTGGRRARGRPPSGRQGRAVPAASAREKLPGSIKCLTAILPSAQTFRAPRQWETNWISCSSCFFKELHIGLGFLGQLCPVAAAGDILVPAGQQRDHRLHAGQGGQGVEAGGFPRRPACNR